ncbi:response regulator [Magnetofaba australis]|uniref:Putative response regulator receiver modulated diguanylate phosphodiesterase n=1 Tax=Magnetofaba australis IT-1 TaxID=1434232 RepID=A0A1Y2K9C1_9PROT|nr:response regulator [Magnetofaba australis]OSM05375.1 putative response regulator receiver modulated diguanylate phosphodiesterase [Magnetofaba australis IT-1]
MGQIDKRVVWIDDDEISLALARRNLEDLQVMEFHLFDNVLEALAYIQNDPQGVAVVFSDIHMPEMDAIELIRALSKTGFKQQLVLVSGANEEMKGIAQSTAQAFGFGPVKMLGKPFQYEQIGALLAGDSA